MSNAGRPKQEYGVGNTHLSPAMYGYIIRMLADGFKNPKIRDTVAVAFPNEPTPSTERIRNVKTKRQPEIAALRKKLNEGFDDIWLANKRQRLEALNLIFQDANRWTPKRAIEMKSTPEQEEARRLDSNAEMTPRQKELREAPRSVLVYEKDTGTMITVLREARTELGEDSGSRQADSLEDLVRLAEQSRDLSKTVEAEVVVDGAVPTLVEAEFADTPTLYPSAGSDEEMGLLDGSTEPGSALLELARGGGETDG